jgi:hypothetical protein
VRVRADGRRRWYRADRDRFNALRLPLEAMWTASLDRLAAMAAGKEKETAPQGPGPQ